MSFIFYLPNEQDPVHLRRQSYLKKPNSSTSAHPHISTAAHTAQYGHRFCEGGSLAQFFLWHLSFLPSPTFLDMARNSRGKGGAAQGTIEMALC